MRWVFHIALAVVALLAFTARLTLMLRGGGLSGSDGYDDSVYLAAATALVHGRLPYRDFVVLHPPGMLLALAPFAALAQLVGDRTGQEIARLTFMALGAANAVLVMRVGNRFGRIAGFAAGVIYAVSYPALYPERTTTLEALGNTAVLVALVLLIDPARRSVPSSGRRSAPADGLPTRMRLRQRGLLIGAGVALGFGTTVKIWGVVALLVLTGWVLLAAGSRAAVWLVGAASLMITVVCLPFFLKAPAAMWRMVVADQLGRPRSTSSLTSRLSTMVGVKEWLPHPPQHVAQPAVLVLLCLLVVAVVVAARLPGGLVVVVLLAAHFLVLVVSPNLYLHYVSLVWVPAAIVLGLAVDQGWQHLSPVLATAAMQTQGCITADDPTYLIAMNVLSRDLRLGCPIWIDPTGIAIDRAGGGDEKAYASTNPAWQRSMMGYLLSGDATMVARAATQLDQTSKARITSLPVIISTENGFVLRTVR